MSKNSTQEYRGNGKHEWEQVHHFTEYGASDGTERLRVPGGWLYRASFISKEVGVVMNTVFVPMPEVVKHSV